MKNEWSVDVEFLSFLKPEKNSDLLAVCEYGSRSTLSQWVSDFADAKELLAEELKKIKKEDNDTAPKTISIGFEGKGSLKAFIHLGDQSNFLLQTAFRKAFASHFACDEESKTVFVTLRGLKESTARTYLNWVVSLAMLSRYRPEVFGKKKESQKALGALKLVIDTGLNKKVAQEIASEAQVMAYANNQVRYLAELPRSSQKPIP
jgi:leucyl aminopeptidase